jgi:ComF family protein
MKYILKRSNYDKILQAVFEAVFPAKCLFCQKVLENMAAKAFVCGECASLHGAAPYDYNDTTKIPIHNLKYNGTKTLAIPMARAIFASLNPQFRNADFLVPVPLYSERQKARGFNQSILLGLELSRLMKIPLYHGLERIRNTVPQAGLNPEKRIINVANAINVAEGAEFAGLYIILIDDIITTGATIDECKRALNAANVAKIDILTFARVCRQ